METRSSPSKRARDEVEDSLNSLSDNSTLPFPELIASLTGQSATPAKRGRGGRRGGRPPGSGTTPTTTGGRGRGRGRGGRGRGRGRGGRRELFASSTEEEDEMDVDDMESAPAEPVVRKKRGRKSKAEIAAAVQQQHAADAAEAEAALELSRNTPMRMFDLEAVREYVTCGLCAEFLTEVYTIGECLHSFCVRCLVKHFGYVTDNLGDDIKWAELDDITARVKGAPSECPVCETHVGAFPMRNARVDPIMQNITDKLVKYLTKQNEKSSQDTEIATGADESKETETSEATHKVHDKSEKQRKQVMFQLLPFTASNGTQDSELWEELEPLDRSYIETWNRVTIRQLKKYLSEKLSLDDGLQVLDILCCGESLGAEYNLEFIRRTRWHNPGHCLQLHYRKKNVSNAL